MSLRSSTPAGINLEQLRTQAKELLRAAQAQSPEAIARFRAHHPRFHNPPADFPKLTHAQLVLAREHGYLSWTKLAAAVQAAALGTADAFVEAAITGKLAVARTLLAEYPNVTRKSIYAAAVYGDVDALRRWLGENRGLANAIGGPRQRPPLLYAAFSRFFQDAGRRPHLLEAVRIFIEAGADVNASYREAPFEDYPLAALYGAAGVLHDAELASILIDAGANLDDNESLYHSVEEKENHCTALLLERGANPNSTNALAHQLDFEDPEGLRLFLSHGANPNIFSPNGGNTLHWAILRRRSAECVGILIEFGADLETRDAEGRTPRQQAVRAGQTEIADLLLARGAADTVTLEDRIAGAFSRGDLAELNALRAAHPDDVAAALAQAGLLLAHAADQGKTEAVRTMLDLGVSPNARGANHATALHWASWQAHGDTVRLLAERGASLESVGADFGTTPLQWAIHGADHNGDRPWEAFEDTLRALTEAGAMLDPAWLEEASEKIRATFIRFSSSPARISLQTS